MTKNEIEKKNFEFFTHREIKIDTNIFAGKAWICATDRIIIFSANIIVKS